MPKPKTDTRYETYSLRLTAETMDALRNIALAKGVAVADLGRQAVEEFISREAAEILQELAADQARREKAARDVINYANQTG